MKPEFQLHAHKSLFAIAGATFRFCLNRRQQKDDEINIHSNNIRFSSTMVVQAQQIFARYTIKIKRSSA